MSMILYVGTRRVSSWSLRPYLVLTHAKAQFTAETITLDVDSSRASIAKVNPAGRVPVLHHDGLVIWDSLAICEYANELYPEAQLWPADRAKRARARAISAEMHSSFVDMRKNMPMDIGANKHGQGHTPEALDDARRVMAIWREQLAASGGPFLFGAFTIADAMFAPVTTRFVTYGVDVDPTCRGYIDAIASFPPMQQWMRDAAAGR
jgi:glutathione S-transferase